MLWINVYKYWQRRYQYIQKLLTNDFQLMAFGRRHDKEQIIELAKDFADITYSLSNIKSGSGGNLAYLTFDVKMDCKLKGEPTTGYAMEAYLFEKSIINGK
jgi:hypothetical protein